MAMIVSYSAFREHLAEYMDAVGENRTELRVTRQGSRTAVLLDEAEYESMMETLHLLRSPENTRRLLEGIADLEAGRGVSRADV
jgi:antitoxin YefM